MPSEPGKPKGLRTRGSRGTNVIPEPEEASIREWLEQRKTVRHMPMEDFIEHLGSGTLRKNARIGMNIASHALSDRVHYEFGAGFRCVPERFVTWGEARSEPDSKASTEVGWYTDRYAHVCLYPGDEMEVKYVTVKSDEGQEEGMGIVIRKTSAPWIPKGYIVFAFIAILDQVKHDFFDAENPC